MISVEEFEAMTIGELMHETGGCHEAIINFIIKFYGEVDEE